MPSTRKQKAKEKKSKQLDVMSDLENMDLMLGAYSRNVLGSSQDDRDITESIH